MIRVHAVTYTAEMVELQTFGDRTDDPLIEQAVGVVDDGVDLESTISAFGDVSRPLPTVASCINLGEKAV